MVEVNRVELLIAQLRYAEGKEICERLFREASELKETR